MAGTGTSSASPAPSPLARAQRFVRLTARVLEQRRFTHHFGQVPDASEDAAPDAGARRTVETVDAPGAAEAVETALTAYRNNDGGYGYGLEPGLRGPVSRPAHTLHALRVLDSVDRCDGARVERICRYLTGVSTAEGALPALHPSPRGHPYAPEPRAAGRPAGELLTTGPVVGVLHRNEVWHAWLFRATEFCWAALARLDESHPYEIEAAVAFLDGVPDRGRAEAAADRLGRLVRERRLVVLDPDRRAEQPVPPGYAPGEHLFPHDYARLPGSLARRWFTEEEMGRSLDFLASEQAEDGGWRAGRHGWTPATVLERRPVVTIEALRTLRAYGRGIRG